MKALIRWKCTRVSGTNKIDGNNDLMLGLMIEARFTEWFSNSHEIFVVL